MNIRATRDGFQWALWLCVSCAAGSLFSATSFSAEQAKGEPSNAAEAAARKSAANALNDEKFAAWKATLPPEQQAWETTLEENLGSFYLPLYKAEKVRGSISAWDYVPDNPDLPRVLLIGDSVSRGYTLAVRKALAGKANVHRAPENCGGTANGLKKLDIWLDGGRWDVIHFNFGIHDRHLSPEVYRQRLEEILGRLQATKAKIIWASTTPIPPDTKEGPAVTAAIVEKNRIAEEIMREHGIPIDDLYGFITPRISDAQNPHDVHFNAQGYNLLGEQVASSILKQLAAP
jgi:lysophospholipase L1-like esterase